VTTNERLAKLLAANPAELAKIDAILTGRDIAPKKEIDFRLVTISEAAKMLGISRPTAYRLIERGRLDTVVLGGVSRIPIRSIADFAEGVK